MNKFKSILYIVLVFAVYANQIFSQPLPAFPGATGFGAKALGGRGGRIIKVTNLKDIGTGSLRWAIDQAPLFANEPRIIIFDVCGVIDGKFTDRIYIKYPYCTIAGQTAPGDGIVLKGSPLVVSNHDVIIRGLRCRPGDNNGFIPSEETTDYDGPDGLTISTQLGLGDIYNVILDHCSISWGVDENTSAFQKDYTKGRIRDITYQWNIISEALDCTGMHKEKGVVQCHSCGFLSTADNSSIHHNLFAHNASRNAIINDGRVTEFLNNTIYNWKHEATQFGDNVDLINNFYKKGADYKHHVSPDATKKSYWELESSASSKSSVYVKGNIGPNRRDDSMNEWKLVYNNNNQLSGEISGVKSNTRVVTNVPIPVTIEPTMQAHENVLKYAGAIAPKRDVTDVRVVQGVIDSTGRILNHISDIGSYPVYTSGYFPDIDTDIDGIPDWFEDENGLNKLVKDGNGTDLSVKFTGREGYTNVEVYINHLIDSQMNVNTANDIVVEKRATFNITQVSKNQIRISGDNIIERVEIISMQGTKLFSSLYLSDCQITINPLISLQGVYIFAIMSDGNYYYQKQFIQ